MSVTVVVQARMGSSRLPGKVLRPLAGRPMLQLQLQRLAPLDVGPIVVATSTRDLDDPIAQLADAVGVSCIRGSETDVLARFARAAAAFPADHIVRLTADCPLIDPALVADVVDHHIDNGFDYTSTTLLRTYPDGLDVEVMRADALREANAGALAKDEREHVTPFMQRNPQRFSLGAYVGERDLEDERWTVDTQDDLTFIASALENISEPESITWLEVLDHFGVRFRPPPVGPVLHVYRGNSGASSTPVLDPAHRTWTVRGDDNRETGTIGIDVRCGGVATIRANVCSTVSRVALLAALERRLCADLQVVDLVGGGDGWANAFAEAGYCACENATYRRHRLPR